MAKRKGENARELSARMQWSWNWKLGMENGIATLENNWATSPQLNMLHNSSEMHWNSDTMRFMAALFFFFLFVRIKKLELQKALKSMFIWEVNKKESHVHPWLIHVNVWQKSPQYCKIISLQLKFKKIKIIQTNKQKKEGIISCYSTDYTPSEQNETLKDLYCVSQFTQIPKRGKTHLWSQKSGLADWKWGWGLSGCWSHGCVKFVKIHLVLYLWFVYFVVYAFIYTKTSILKSLLDKKIIPSHIK